MGPHPCLTVVKGLPIVRLLERVMNCDPVTSAAGPVVFVPFPCHHHLGRSQGGAATPCFWTSSKRCNSRRWFLLYAEPDIHLLSAARSGLHARSHDGTFGRSADRGTFTCIQNNVLRDAYQVLCAKHVFEILASLAYSSL